VQASFPFCVDDKGSGVHLLKANSKRRRTKAQLHQEVPPAHGVSQREADMEQQLLAM